MAMRWFHFVISFTLFGCGSAAPGVGALARTPSGSADSERGDSSIAGGDGAPLDRAAFVRAVLRRNPGLDASRAAIRAALARVRESGAFEDPMVDLGVAPLSIGSSKAPFGYEASISQRLPWFGKRGLEEAATAAEASAARSDLEVMKRELALMASTLYDQYTVLARSRDVGAHHVELMRTLRASATAQLEAGRGSLQDPVMAELALARMERDQLALATEQALTVSEMNELLHRAPEDALARAPADVVLLPAPDLKDGKHLENTAVDARPEIAALRERARAESARESRAGKEYLPDFTISTSYNSMWEMPEHRWMVGLAFNLPIFAGKRAAAGEEAAARRSEYQSEAARAEDQARKQVFSALKGLEESKRALELFDTRLLPLAKDQIDAARAGFVAGRNPFMTVVEAERGLRDLELEHLRAKAEWNRKRAELDRALGLIPVVGEEGAAR